MPFYDPEENQDGISAPPGLRQPSYLAAGNTIATIPDQRLGANGSNVALPVKGVVRRGGGVNPMAPASTLWPRNEQKLGIGHRIVGMEEEPQIGLNDQFSRRSQDQINTRLGAIGIGHRILAASGDRPGRAAWQSQPFAKTSNAAQLPRYGPAMLLHDRPQQQGIFSSFVPRGSNRAAKADPFFIASTGSSRLDHSNSAIGTNPASSARLGSERNSTSFNRRALDVVPMANSSGQAEKGMEPELAPTEVAQRRRHQPGKPQNLQAPRVSQAPRHAVAQTSPGSPTPEMETYIREQAAAYGIPEALALGLVNKESHFDPNLRGALKEVGLFQIKPKSKPEIIEDAKGNKFAIDMKRAASDWKYNVTAGLALLKRAYKQAQKSSPKDVIAATYAHYNGGDKNWIYYTRKNAPVHYHIYGQSIKRHGKSMYVEGYLDFYHKWGGK